MSFDALRNLLNRYKQQDQLDEAPLEPVDTPTPLPTRSPSSEEAPISEEELLESMRKNAEFFKRFK